MNKQINDMIVNEVVENGGRLTENVHHALYLLTDGRMIDGVFEEGCGRTEDHTMIEVVLGDRYAKDFWERVHFELGLVRLTPETKIALINKGQELTEIQKEIILKSGYNIEEY
ncbi:hypothetical protein NSQ93_22495 [Bacillus sp. FSL W8-0445]|uniref:hypothetical protein n=1 Tax=Bacillota TaxID=1239 RepID=UPI000779C59A|nr:MULTISPECIES: hypothetical protein [Bacillota]MCY8549354.1 hypothetical protein [Bacillus haynesii]MDE1407020.1 hypothetical protein [Bacillus licheniformis]NFT30588.1 hypothetical protein [Clostridium sporogenes]OJT57337.1 hypothetical protein BFP47_11550 [Bacillus licheniformis]OJT70021.1 hypothetical protein BFP46_05340 [Bacillus licheniformis]